MAMTNEQLRQLIDIGKSGREECKDKDCDECSYYYTDDFSLRHCLKKDIGDYLTYVAWLRKGGGS